MDHHGTRVGEIMTSRLYTLTPTQSLPLAESLMELANIRHIPVVDGGRLVGLVTQRDILRASLSGLSPLTRDERSDLQLAVPVSRLMQTNLWTIESSALAVTAARILNEHRFGCLPVVDEGRLVGIVTEADLLTLLVGTLAPRVEPHAWSVERAMTPFPTTLAPTATIADARAAMRNYRVRHLPVVEAGSPIGVVSDRDLRVAEAVYPDPSEARALRAIQLVGTEGRHVVDAAASLDAVLLDMSERRLDAVLVVARGRLVGILTAVDACRMLGLHLRQTRETEKSAACAE
jgi:CBS domain-containing membrane protein